MNTVELAAQTSGSGGLSSSPSGDRSVGPRVSNLTDAEILFGQLQWSMLLRLVAVSILFGIVIVMRLRGQGPVDLLAALYPLFMALYAVSGLYAVVAKRMPNLVFFAYLQFAVDAACIRQV